MVDRKRLADLLGSLGDTPDKIADTLVAAGVTGKRGIAKCCPIARWLQRNGITDASVGPRDVAVGEDDEGMVELPDPVKVFVENFDLGYGYAALDEGGVVS